MSSGEVSVLARTEQLQVGSSLKHDMFDEHGTLLLAAGSTVTADLKAQLLRRGIESLTAHPDDLETNPPQIASNVTVKLSAPEQTAARVKSLADTIAFELRCGNPLAKEMSRPRAVPYDPERQEQLEQQFEATVGLVSGMVETALTGDKQDGQPLHDAVGGYAESMKEDSDHVVASNESMGHDHDVCKRAVRMATLAMAAAIRRGFDRDNVQQVGVCALIHDWGQYCLPERFRDPMEPYSDRDWQDYMRHPGYTLDVLEQIKGVPDEVRLAAVQVHEQLDGSGYPSGLERDQIHPYARILNVVDQYMFLTSSYRGRPAFVPYDAIVYLLRQTKAGRFDSDSVRAVVEVLSIFPVGSHVRLSNQAEAKVIRPNGNEHTKPVVQTVAHGNTSIVDLANSDLKIDAPMPTPGRAEMRLDDELMREIIWQGPDA